MTASPRSISQTEGAIGYPELQYAISSKLTYGNVKNKKGTFIKPCVATTSAAAVKTSFPPDMRTSLTWRGGSPIAYPITGTTFALVYQNQTDAGQGQGARQLPQLGADDRAELPGHDQLRPDGQDPAAARAGAAQQDHAQRQAAGQDPD